jgi:hypothetical protein
MAACACAGRPITAPRAGRLADEIAACGGLDQAVQALANDDAFGALGDLLAYRAALAEIADPSILINRLRRDASDLDARAEPAWAEAADLYGRARFRELRGEADLADGFRRRAEAAERLAATLEAEAFAKRLQAARLQAEQAQRQGLAAALGDIAGLAA